MNVAIVGGGIIGVCTAYALIKSGFNVTLFEKNEDVALEASFANGGQLSYSYVMPLAEPAALKKLPIYLINANSPLKFNFKFDIQQWRWGLHFIRACTVDKSAQTTKELLNLSYFSRDILAHFLDAHVVDSYEAFGFRNNGKLVIYRDLIAFNSAKKQVELQQRISNRIGADQSFILDASECLKIEPALLGVIDKIIGGIYTPTESLADCHLFSQYVLKILRDSKNAYKGIFDICFNTHVLDINLKAAEPKIRLALNDTKNNKKYNMCFDQVILTTGIESLAFSKLLRLPMPLYALKGYSLTIPLKENDVVPEISVTDSANKIVYARLGNTLRIAAMVDMGDGTKNISSKRINQLISQAKELFPDLNYDDALQWAGLRPATAQGKPIIGESPIKNVWLNIGQGALGFTLAMGSAHLLSELMHNAYSDAENKCELSIDPSPFSYKNVR